MRHTRGGSRLPCSTTSFLLLAALALAPSRAAAKQHMCDGELHGISWSDDKILLSKECDLMYDDAEYTSNGGIPNLEIAPVTTKYTDVELVEIMDHVKVMLPERQIIDSTLLEENGASLFVSLTENSTVNVTYLYEGACYRNSIGMIAWETALYPDPSLWLAGDWRQKVLDDNDITIFMPNIDEEFCKRTNPALQKGQTMRLKPDPRNEPDLYVFEAGTSFSLFIIPDGFNDFWNSDGFGSGPGEKIDDLIWSVSALNKDSIPGDKRQHAALFAPDPDAYPTTLVWAFEDIFRHQRNSDEDVNDVIFIVDIDPFHSIGNYIVAGTPTPAPTGAPTKHPTNHPTKAPTNNPTHHPTDHPTKNPTNQPTDYPTNHPTKSPTNYPTDAPHDAAMCVDGIRDQNLGMVCCDPNCGKCGGCNCASRPGFGRSGSAGHCCPETIIASEIFCTAATDTACIITDIPDELLASHKIHSDISEDECIE